MRVRYSDNNIDQPPQVKYFLKYFNVSFNHKKIIKKWDLLSKGKMLMSLDLLLNEEPVEKNIHKKNIDKQGNRGSRIQGRNLESSCKIH